MARRVFTVVLTGGIASGKTAVSDSFRQLGVPVIDTDVIAKELVEPGQPALERIAELFGGLLHPLIAEEVLRRMEHIGSPYCIIVIPLYAESGSYRWVDRVLVVDVSEEQQIDRVMARDQISRRQAEAILDAQADRQERLALADDVVDNSGSLSELASQVEDLHRKYSSLGSA